MLLFYQGMVEDGAAFFRRLWPEARAVSDLPRTFYQAVGIERGGLAEMFSPEVVVCGVRAAAKGHLIGAPVGDPWLMPGLMLADADGAIRWRHTFRHAGDHPDFAAIPRLTRLSAS